MKRFLFAGATVLTVVALLAPVAGARMELLPLSARPNGYTYHQWHILWDNASFNRSIQSRNSLIAVRGNKCGFAIGSVWLLPVSINPEILNISCTIPRGKRLALVVGGIFDIGKNEARLRATMASAWPMFVSSSLTVDGRPLRPGYVLQTPLVHVRMPLRNSYDVPPGLTAYMTRERFAILSPPGPGRHLISTRATFTGFGTPGVDYHLTIL